jgi:hypothetical protein
MGYRTQSGSPKGGGRGHQRSPHEKKKAKEKKNRSSGKYLLEETNVPTLEEVAEKTLSRLRSLGHQTFALFPFSAYFDNWLVNLKDVLVTFESSPNVSVDEQFVEERSQIIATVESKLEQRRREELSLQEAVRSISDGKILLEQIESDCAAKVRTLEERKNSETPPLQQNIASLKRELDDLAIVKAGFFRSISKKAKAKKEADLTQKLNAAQSELELAIQKFADEKESLWKEYEERKQAVNVQIRDYEGKIERIETDDSIDDRVFACDALVNAVNAFTRRKTLQLQ